MAPMVPGEWLLRPEPVDINRDRRTLRISVRNTGDRPIQVGSHFHMFEVNRVLDFDRPATLGMRLDVPSGQSIRFESGDEREVDLVEFGGSRRVLGFNNLLDGSLSAQPKVEEALRRASALGFAGARDAVSAAAKENSR
jgi:urease subunit beta/urease subunit gamma/beta